MKVLGILAAALVVCGIANASEVNDSTPLGAQDSRGAYQEVHFKTFSLTRDYFDEYVLESLKTEKINQAKYNIFADSKYDFGGIWVQVYFQDNIIKTLNKSNTHYKTLDLERAYCSVGAIVSFDNRKQLATGIYKVDGTVTLVTGTSHVGPIMLSTGTPDSKFNQGTMLGYKNSGAYNYNHGAAFNAFGNGKNDQGRIQQVGCESFSRSDEITAGLLKKTAGPLVEIVYP